MGASTPYEAFENFRTPLQTALSCVHRKAHMWALMGSNGYSPGKEHALAPNRGEPVDLPGQRRIKLISLFTYRIELAGRESDLWKVRTSAYRHALEDQAGQEIIAYHWHPSQGSVYNFPHLHIGTGIGASLGDVHKFHIPTGRVALEDVLRLVIREFGVEAQRPDWEQVLWETQTDHEAGRTWHGLGPLSPPPKDT